MKQSVYSRTLHGRFDQVWLLDTYTYLTRN